MNAPVTAAKRSRAMVAQLKQSPIYRDYEQAFRETTGLPIALRPIEAFDLPHSGDPKENRFCAMMAQCNRSCAACLQLQERVEKEAISEPKTLRCFAGMSDSAVPIRIGGDVIAFLQTGQLFVEPPTKQDFDDTVHTLVNLGGHFDLARAEELYFQTRVLSKKQHESVLRLLAIFAQHLASLSNQLMVRSARSEAPVIARARVYISEHHENDLTLTEVAKAMNSSAFYFCKMFKKATGMTFTDYLARVRVEKVKTLLLNPHTRISEAAFDAGFQSLSQFNRVFRRVAGEAPSMYRERLHGQAKNN